MSLMGNDVIDGSHAWIFLHDNFPDTNIGLCLPAGMVNWNRTPRSQLRRFMQRETSNRINRANVRLPLQLIHIQAHWTLQWKPLLQFVILLRKHLILLPGHRTVEQNIHSLVLRNLSIHSCVLTIRKQVKHLQLEFLLFASCAVVSSEIKATSESMYSFRSFIKPTFRSTCSKQQSLLKSCNTTFSILSPLTYLFELFFYQFCDIQKWCDILESLLHWVQQEESYAAKFNLHPCLASSYTKHWWGVSTKAYSLKVLVQCQHCLWN